MPDQPINPTPGINMGGQLSQGIFVNPDPSIIKRGASAESIFQRLRNVSNASRPQLLDIAENLSRTAGADASIQFTVGTDIVAAHFKDRSVNIPIFTKQGFMRHGRSLYGVIGGIDVVTEKGVGKHTLQELLYGRMQQIARHQGMGAEAKFSQIQSVIEGLFAPVTAGGQQMVAGAEAGFIQPLSYLGEFQARAGMHMQRQRAVIATEGTRVFGLIQQEQEYLKRFSGAAGRKAKLVGGQVQHASGLPLAEAQVLHEQARRRVTDAVLALDPSYHFLMTSASGKAVFRDIQEGAISPFALTGYAPANIAMMRVSAGAPSQFMAFPTTGAIEKGLHQLLRPRFMPTPGVPRGMSPYTTIHSITQPSTYLEDVGAAKAIYGRPGTFGIPMTTGVILDPATRQLVHADSGALISGTRAVSSLSYQRTYTRTVKVATRGAGLTSGMIGAHMLDPGIARIIRENIKRTGQLEAGGSAVGAPYKHTLKSTQIGQHLDVFGEIPGGIVQAEGVGDVLVGHEYKKHTGELKLIFKSKTPSIKAIPLLVGRTRVTADVGEPLYYSQGGKMQPIDILADISLTERQGGQLRLKAGRLINAPADLFPLQLEAMAQRTYAHKSLRGAGLRLFAQTFGGRYTQYGPGMPVVLGAGTRQGRSFGQSIEIYKRGLEKLLGGGSNAAKIARQITEYKVGVIRTSAGATPKTVGGVPLPGEISALIFEGIPIAEREGMAPTKFGKGSVGIKLGHLRYLSETLTGYAKTPADRAAFNDLIRMAHSELFGARPEVFEDIANMARGYVGLGPPPGAAIVKNAQDYASLFGNKIPVTTAREFKASDLLGTALVTKGGKIRDKGFWIELPESISLPGGGTVSAGGKIPLASKASKYQYIFSPALVNFAIENGLIRKGGGRGTYIPGTTDKRALLDILIGAETAAGPKGLDIEQLQTRLGAAYETILESALGSKGAISRARFEPTTAARLLVGYHPTLREGEIGLTSTAIRKLFREQLGAERPGKGIIQDLIAGKDTEVYVSYKREPQGYGGHHRIGKIVNIEHTKKQLYKDLGVKITADDYVFMSRAGMFMSDADRDADFADLFLLSDKRGKHWQLQQEVYQRMYAEQTKFAEYIEKLTTQVRDVSYTDDAAALAKSIAGFDKTILQEFSPEQTARALEAITTPKAYTPIAETFWRSRLLLARDIDRLAEGTLAEQEAINIISKYAKAGTEGRTEQLIRQMVQDRGRAFKIGSLHNVAKYELLIKAANRAEQGAYKSIEFMDQLIAQGGYVAQHPETFEARADELSKIIYDLMESEAVAEGKLPKKAHYAITGELAASRAKLMSEATEQAKALLTYEQIRVLADIEHPIDALIQRTATIAQRQAERGGAGVMNAAVMEYLAQYTGGQYDYDHTETMERMEDEIAQRQGVAARGAAMRQQAMQNDALVANIANKGITERVKTTTQAGEELISRITKSKFFKPAVIGIGALAGWEVLKSAFSGPSDPPPATPLSAAPLPPPPLLDRPTQETFDPNFIPRNNIARIERIQGARTHLSVHGKADRPADFGNLSSTVLGGYGIVPVQNGTFRDERSGDISRRDADRYIRDRLRASY